jgi:hypothetical protein
MSERKILGDVAAYRGPHGEAMATWADLDGLLYDCPAALRAGEGDLSDEDRHACGWLLAALLGGDLRSAVRAIRTYERQVGWDDPYPDEPRFADVEALRP